MTQTDNAITGIALDALELGQKMREAQKAYFQSRSGDALRNAKDLERRFDAAAKKAADALRRGYVAEQGVLL